MKVFVIVSTMENDLHFRIIRPDGGMSRLVVLSGQAQWMGGNPYSVYGKYVREWLGLPDGSYDFSIVVAQITSGSIS